MPDAVTPPPWEDDPLSRYFAEAEHNTRASWVNFRDVYEVQQRAHRVLLRVADAFEHDTGNPHHIGVPRMLLIRSHSAILTTMRLAMSGQGFEAQTVLRVAIEHAWYALHITRDPAPPARAHVWWDRGDGEEREAERPRENRRMLDREDPNERRHQHQEGQAGARRLVEPSRSGSWDRASASRRRRSRDRFRRGRPFADRPRPEAQKG